MKLQNRIIFAQVTKREVVCESTLSCFPISTKFTLMSLKNTICLDDRLSQGGDIGYCCEMRAFWRSSESLAPSVPLPEVRPDGASGALACCSAFYLAFLTLHQSQSDGGVGLG